MKEEQISKLKTDLRRVYAQGTILKSQDEQEADLQACISVLSLTGATSTAVDLADKMSGVNLKSND